MNLQRVPFHMRFLGAPEFPDSPPIGLKGFLEKKPGGCSVPGVLAGAAPAFSAVAAASWVATRSWLPISAPSGIGGAAVGNVRRRRSGAGAGIRLGAICLLATLRGRTCRRSFATRNSPLASCERRFDGSIDAADFSTKGFQLRTLRHVGLPVLQELLLEL